MKKAFAGLIATLLFLGLTSMGVVRAEEGLPPEPQMPPEAQPQIPGRLEGTGTHFELTNSEYLNITLDSSQPIKLILESVPEMVTLHLESASGATSTEITMGGFLPSTTYHKYEDDYHNHTPFTTDASGKYTYTQDLSQPHLVFIQPRASTIYLSDTGWSEPVGTWDPATRTGTLTQDVNQTIQISSNSITLDGGGHTVTGTNTGNGVYLYGRTGVTIKNLNIRYFSYGIYLERSSGNTLTGNTASSNGSIGIYLYASDYNMLTNNTANSNGSYGIRLYASGSNRLTSNTANWNKWGIYLYYVGSNTLTSNTANSNYHGIYLLSTFDNTLTSNNASLNWCGIYLAFSSSNRLTSNNASSNSRGIIVSSSSGNTLTRNTADLNIAYGITLSFSNGSTLDSNSANSNNTGIYLASSSGNTLTRNTASNGYWGINLESSSNNTLTGNTASSNNYGIRLASSSNNKIYNNNFINNSTQAYVSGGSGNVFNLDKPVGGNYWSNWWTPDINNDGFVDNPYVFTGGQDNLPWAVQNGWLDKTPPTTTISLSGTPGNNGWYRSDVVVTLAATDNEGGTGVKKTQYSFDNATWNIYTAPLAINTEGIKTVYYKSIDKAGNVEVVTIFSDTFTEPNGPAAGWTPRSGTWVVENGEYSGMSSPNLGASSDIGDSTWTDYKVEVRVYPIDSVNHWRAGLMVRTDPNAVTGYLIHSFEGGLRILKQLPQGGVQYDHWVYQYIPANAWHTLGIEVKGNNTKFYFNGQFQAEITDGSPFSSGGVSLRAWADNYAGHVHFDDVVVTAGGTTYKSQIIKIDKTTPSTNISLAGTLGSNGWYVSDVAVTLTATDNNVVAATQYGFDGTTWNLYSGPFTISSGPETTVYYRSTDEAGNTEATKSSLVKIDKNPPTTSISLDGTLGNNGWYRSDVTVTLSAVDNEGGLGEGATQYSFDNATWNIYSAPLAINTEGIKTVYYKSIDKAGNAETAKSQIIKIDKTAPTLTFGTPTPAPNAAGWNKTDVSVPFTASDNLSGVAGTNPATSPIVLTVEGSAVTGTVTVTDKAGNSAPFTTPSFKIDKTLPTISGSRTPAPNSNGWNNTDVTIHFTAADALSGIDTVTPDTTISTEGANQSVTGKATDKAGNSSSCTVGGINIDKTPPQASSVVVNPNPVGVNIGVTLTATVNDSGTVSSKIASAQYRIDNGEWMSMTAVDGAFGGVTENVSASIGPWTTSGVHNIDVRGQDGAGNYSSVESILLAVYDPGAGFVTGGGWINSPASAYRANPTLTGKATFGFVSKYQKGATVPTGQTEFQFRVASLNFHSSSYEWLVIAGARAQYKGSGTINGSGDYGFMLTAIDGQLLSGGDGVDKFRIKIWDKATDSLIYDNQLGAADTADPATAIAGGSIVIHKG